LDLTSYMLIFNPPPYSAQFTNIQIASFGLSIQPSSDLFIIKSYAKNTYWHFACEIEISFPSNKRHKTC